MVENYALKDQIIILNKDCKKISGLISTVVKDTSVMGVDRSLKKSIGTIDELAQMIKLDYDEYDALVLTLKGEKAAAQKQLEDQVKKLHNKLEKQKKQAQA